MTDLEEIRTLVHRYADSVCCTDTDRWAATWAPDALWDIGRGPVTGRDAIRTAYERAMGLFEAVIQIALNGSAEVDPSDSSRASGRWYMSEHALTRSGIALLYLGHYDDEYVRSDQGWQFSSRRLTWRYQGPPDLTGTFGPPPGYWADED